MREQHTINQNGEKKMETTTLTAAKIEELAKKLEATHPGTWKTEDLIELIRATEKMNS
jgi:hypothetical protein